MSQEEEEIRSQSSTEPFSWLESDDVKSHKVEVCTEDSENLEWDNYRENPSFILDPEEDPDRELAEESAVHTGRVSSTDDQFLERDLPPVINQFVFDYNRDNQYSVWPPRHPSSEGEIFLEENLLPKELLAAIQEEGTEGEDELFFDATTLIEEATMGPKPAPTVAQLYDKFKERVDEFNELTEVVGETGEPPDKDTLNDLDNLNQTIKSLVNDMKKIDPNYEAEYTEVGTKKKQVVLSLVRLRQAREKVKDAAAAPCTDSNEEAQETANVAVSALGTEFSTWEKVLNSTETKLMKNFEETPEPHSYEVADTEKLLNDLRAVEESAKPLYIKLTVEISKIKEADKKTEQLKIAEDAWSQLQSKVSLLTRKGQEYKSKFTPAPGPTVPQPAQSHPRSVPLERLPLPIFSGAKADYLKFKQKFKDHVKYETEQEKLMALQSKCLSKDDDKKTVANEVTLKGCWEKLDYEYGDIDTLVAEIFSNWTDLKPPKNDKEFVQFVKQIDYGVATLETLGHGKDVDSSHMSVMLEKKLSEEQKT